MIKQSTKLINQLVTCIHFDSSDKSIVRISFDSVVTILLDNDIIIPKKIFEDTLNKILSENLIGKAKSTDPLKYKIAQAILETALLLAVSKEEIIKHKIKTNQA